MGISAPASTQPASSCSGSAHAGLDSPIHFAGRPRISTQTSSIANGFIAVVPAQVAVKKSLLPGEDSNRFVFILQFDKIPVQFH